MGGGRHPSSTTPAVKAIAAVVQAVIELGNGSGAANLLCDLTVEAPHGMVRRSDRPGAAAKLRRGLGK